MKTMKSLIVSLALFIGLVGVSHAGGRLGQGWNVTTVTGTFKVISDKHTYVKAVFLSSAPVAGDPGWAILLTTGPEVAFGSDNSPTGGPLFLSTAAVSPFMLYRNTTTITAAGDLLGAWKPADGDDTGYIEVPKLQMRQSLNSSGSAGIATVIWSN